MIPKLFWWTNQPTLIEVLYDDSHFSRCDRLVKSSYVFYFWARVMERYKGHRSGSTFAIWVSLKIGDTPIGWDMYTLNEPFQTEFRQMKDKFFFQRFSMNHGLKMKARRLMFSCHYSHTHRYLGKWRWRTWRDPNIAVLRYCDSPLFFFKDLIPGWFVKSWWPMMCSMISMQH